jgi:hypothetical protein
MRQLLMLISMLICFSVKHEGMLICFVSMLIYVDLYVDLVSC